MVYHCGITPSQCIIATSPHIKSDLDCPHHPTFGAAPGAPCGAWGWEGCWIHRYRWSRSAQEPFWAWLGRVIRKKWSNCQGKWRKMAGFRRFWYDWKGISNKNRDALKGAEQILLTYEWRLVLVFFRYLKAWNNFKLEKNGKEPSQCRMRAI